MLFMKSFINKFVLFLSLQCCILFSGITTINIYSDQKDNIYYVEEDITITAEFGNPSAVKYVRWQKNETNTNFSSIATTSPKYTGTRYENFKHLLMIRKCCESDTGSYSLLVTCIDDVDITSNSIDIKVVRGELHFQIFCYSKKSLFQLMHTNLMHYRIEKGNSHLENGDLNM